jgi:hypothetical protein
LDFRSVGRVVFQAPADPAQVVVDPYCIIRQKADCPPAPLSATMVWWLIGEVSGTMIRRPGLNRDSPDPAQDREAEDPGIL